MTTFDIRRAGGQADFLRADLDGSLAAAAVFLASDDAAFVHGTVVDVDGGRTGVAVVADAGAFHATRDDAMVTRG